MKKLLKPAVMIALLTLLFPFSGVLGQEGISSQSGTSPQDQESTTPTSAAVVQRQSGDKIFFEIDMVQLQQELSELLQSVSGYESSSDSMSVNLPVTFGQTLNVLGTTTIGDSLFADLFLGNRILVDSISNWLEENLVISADEGTVSLSADSVISSGHFLAKSNATFESNASIDGTLTVDSLSVTDVINGEVLQVSNLGNQSTDALNEGTTNLYFTEQRAIAALSDTITYLLGLIQELQEGGGASGGESSSFTCGTSTVTYDGHDYSTVQIGDQCWFAENLQTTQYADGSAISEVTDGTAWSGTSDGARAAYNNDNSNLATYGYLYNWYAVESTAGLCPTGWHVPTDEEWTTLTDGLGGAAGGAMKSAVPSWDGTNSSGFSALPGGYRMDTGSFYTAGTLASFWSSSPDGSSAWFRELYSNSNGVARNQHVRRHGKSVRCVRDAAAGSSASVPTVSSAAASDLAETTATLNGTVDGDGGDAVTATGFVWGTDASLSGASDASGSATSGSFTASLTGLTGGTTYYFSAYATNGEGTAYGDTLSFTTTAAAAAFTCGTSTVTFDSHDYSTVQIGDQCWFAENLRTETFANGDSIPGELSNAEWTSTESAAQTINSSLNDLSTYGRLYNAFAVRNSSGLCPTGWHVPTDDEFTALTDFLGGLAIAGSKMKASSEDSPSWDGSTVEPSGFAALPGGGRNPYTGNATYAGYGAFWSSTEDSGGVLYMRELQTGYDDVRRLSKLDRFGLSVRCIQD